MKKAEYDLAGRVIGLAMKIHRVLGPGFLESVYRKALQVELLRAGFKVEMEAPIQIRYEGTVVGDYFADLLIDDELIVEIKAVTTLMPAHEAQTVNYLTAAGKNEAVLLNFGAKSLEFKKKFRTYQDPEGKPPAFHENFVNSVNSV
jgi:GxxExxY protein